MIELYHHGTSVCAAKPRIVLAEKGVAWEGRYVDILKGEQFRPEYKKLNPKAVVPTLVHDGRVIIESTIICEYLDEVFPAPPLKPDEPGDRAQMRFWNKRVDEEGFPVTGPLTYAISHRHAVIANGPAAVEAFVSSLGPAAVERRRRRLELGIDDEEARHSLRTWDRILADMERWLSHHQWLAGARFSLAEACMTPFINRLDMLQLSFMWTEGRPHVTKWFEGIKARAWFEPMMLGFVPPPLRKLMQEKGLEAQPRARAILAQEA